LLIRRPARTHDAQVKASATGPPKTGNGYLLG
jgi:hypothetical protein